MQIVSVDNLNRESVADRLVVGSIPNTDQHRAKAQQFCDWLNTFTCHGHGGRFNRLLPDDYRLSRGMEDLI
ncbi:hypothetical protein EN780_03410 [Mesorhizobium sp. M4B.F.Ca.ET.089.01.1.1]|uniref:hypothetical protein n=1 Tax=Mesorhizobium sp. M4B.F.Ca.ET.089.01.1.1 TaxID=2496662 RepID=UPI000FE42DCE|nr:hypothetical protein [Mesorhizobium sp. M4B.F.Ca.ET.089.01.1.1]RWX70455.1 hypothetical protein EN780_03410 [Mesorhizobium sp. M4B.F.Ca.ET.089.01.1.1]